MALSNILAILGDMRRIVTVSMEEVLWARLERLVDSSGLSRSALVESLLKDHLIRCGAEGQWKNAGKIGTGRYSRAGRPRGSRNRPKGLEVDVEL